MHIQGRRLLIAAAIAALLLPAGRVRAEEEERPKIFLEKKIFADTSDGKKSFYEVHTVAQGENLWKIFHGKGLSATDYSRTVKEFLKANPDVSDPGRLKAGQKILLPSAVARPRDSRIAEGKAAPHRVVKGDTLGRILADRGVPRRELTQYLGAVKELNESIRDINRIILGSTILIPTAEYFAATKTPGEGKPVELARRAPAEPAGDAPKDPANAPAPVAIPEVAPVETPKSAVEPPKEASKEHSRVPPDETTMGPDAAPAPKEVPKEIPEETPKEAPKPVPPPVGQQAAHAAPAIEDPTKKPDRQEPAKILTGEIPPPAPQKEAPSVPQEALTKEVPPEPVKAADAPAKPEVKLGDQPAPETTAPVVKVRPHTAETGAVKKEEPPLPPPKPPYRGLLTDLLAALGEKWADRGTLYLPVPSGGEVILSLEEFPVARFSNGTHVLVDFRGALPLDVRALVTQTWKNYRVVSMEGSRDAWEILRRLLDASGYHSVKEGLSRPLVIGEGVSVTLPARWVVLRTKESLLSGEVILVKEVPEKPSGDLAAVLKYADRVGIRVIPLATDPGVMEGFAVGFDDNAESEGPPLRLAAPAGGLPALDFALDFLGIPRKEGERLRIGGKGESFQLIVQPERLFEAGGKRHIADTGRMAPALKTLLKDAGYKVFPVLKEETGRTIFQRVLKEAGISTEQRREHLLSGGEKEGFFVRATGTFITSKGWLERNQLREALLFGGKAHSATRTLVRDLGVEIVEW